MHEGNTMNSGHYYCEVLYFKTGTCRRCDYEETLKLSGLIDNAYSEFIYYKSLNTNIGSTEQQLINIFEQKVYIF